MLGDVCYSYGYTDTIIISKHVCRAIAVAPTDGQIHLCCGSMFRMNWEALRKFPPPPPPLPKKNYVLHIIFGNAWDVCSNFYLKYPVYITRVCARASINLAECAHHKARDTFRQVIILTCSTHNGADTATDGDATKRYRPTVIRLWSPMLNRRGAGVRCIEGSGLGGCEVY